MIGLKSIADILTFSRIIISAILAWLGWSQGEGGLSLVCVLMMISWTSDILDGFLARRSRIQLTTWIGDHDLFFDMAVALGLLIFMTVAGFINTSISIFYILGWTFIFWILSILPVLGKLFQAPIYAWLVFIAFRYEPLFGCLIVIFLLIVIVITWPRFPQDTVPSFLSGFSDDRSSRDGSQNDLNGAENPENGK